MHSFDTENVFLLDFAVVGALLSLHLALFTIDQISFALSFQSV